MVNGAYFDTSVLRSRRTMIVVASGEGSAGASVSAALLSLASSAWGPTLCVEAGTRNAGIRWTPASRPAFGFVSLVRGIQVQDMALSVTRSLDAIQARGQDDAGESHRPAQSFARLQEVLRFYDTVIVDAATSIGALAGACDVGDRGGMQVKLLLVSATGGASLAATHAMLKAARRMGVSAPAHVLVAAQESDAAASVHAMLDTAAQRFLGENLGFAGAIPRDACLATALRGGMTLLDAAAGSPALDAAAGIASSLLGRQNSMMTDVPAGTAAFPVAPEPVAFGARADWGS
jgi:MinD-like ATPase involved in chromosome partitioning or flagellar assembly